MFLRSDSQVDKAQLRQTISALVEREDRASLSLQDVLGLKNSKYVQAAFTEMNDVSATHILILSVGSSISIASSFGMRSFGRPKERMAIRTGHDFYL